MISYSKSNSSTSQSSSSSSSSSTSTVPSIASFESPDTPALAISSVELTTDDTINTYLSTATVDTLLSDNQQVIPTLSTIATLAMPAAQVNKNVKDNVHHEHHEHHEHHHIDPHEASEKAQNFIVAIYSNIKSAIYTVSYTTANIIKSTILTTANVTSYYTNLLVTKARENPLTTYNTLYLTLLTGLTSGALYYEKYNRTVKYFPAHDEVHGAPPMSPRILGARIGNIRYTPEDVLVSAGVGLAVMGLGNIIYARNQKKY